MHRGYKQTAGILSGGKYAQKLKTPRQTPQPSRGIFISPDLTDISFLAHSDSHHRL